jgi:hypothetical protein
MAFDVNETLKTTLAEYEQVKAQIAQLDKLRNDLLMKGLELQGAVKMLQAAVPPAAPAAETPAPTVA